MRVLIYFARQYPWQGLIVLLCLLLAAVMEGIGLTAALPVLSVAIEGEQAVQDPTGLQAMVLSLSQRLGFEPKLEPLLLFLVTAFILKALLMLLSKRQVGYTVAHVATDMRLGLLRALLAARWSYYTRQPVGLAANAMASEASRAANAYYSLAQISAHGIQALIAIGVALAISWQATLASAVGGAAMVAALGVFVRMSGRAGLRQTDLLKSLLGRLTDSLQVVRLLKATGREPLIGPLLEDDTRRLNKALRKQVLGKESLRSLQEPIIVAFAAAILFVSRSVFAMSGPEVLLLIGLFARTLGSVGKAQRRYQHLVIDESALWSLREMIDAAEREREPEGGDARPQMERALELSHIDFAYEGHSVFEDLCLEVPAGGITAIVGASGAGKTTIVDLITGLVSSKGGHVRIDGRPIEEVDLRGWREMIGYVPQETLMLHDSVRVNVTLGDPKLTDADAERALRDAGVWDVVTRLPGGLDASVGERGSLLSGGQRQRIAIARALVHEPRLLILDEATANLDLESEQAVWDTVAALRGKTTVVAISHQPALVGVADRIYRIEGGTASRIEPGGSASASAEGVA